MIVYLFSFILTGVALYVVRCGDRELRIALTILVANFCLSLFFYITTGRTWLDWPLGVLATDAAASALLVALALRSDRFWPIPIASLMLIPVSIPLVALVGQGLESDALGWTQGIWSYIQLLILALATKRHRLRLALAHSRTSDSPSPTVPGQES